MAVVDKYVGAEFTGTVATTQTIAPGTRPPALNSKGEHLICLTQTLEVAAADNNGSIYRLFKGLSSGLRPVRIDVMCDALTGGTSFDLGFYPTNGGTIASAADGLKNALMSAQTLAVASNILNGLGNVAIENIGNKSIADLLGHSVELGTDKLFYDMALTGNTTGGTGGTVTVVAYFAQQ